MSHLYDYDHDGHTSWGEYRYGLTDQQWNDEEDIAQAREQERSASDPFETEGLTPDIRRDAPSYRNLDDESMKQLRRELAEKQKHDEWVSFGKWVLAGAIIGVLLGLMRACS